LTQLKEKGVKAYAAVAGGGAIDITKADLSGGVIAVIGNEGNGLTQECIGACEAGITVRMRGRAESLNAAAAATIIMWEITKHRS
jgi:TrmH family RNA methyltransferase